MRDIPTNRLDKRVVASWRIEASVWFVILAVGAAGTLALIGSSSDVASVMKYAWIIFAIVFAAYFLVFLILVPSYRYAAWRFEVTPTEVDIAEGIIFKRRTVIPLVRIQSVNTSQGPILRMFNISTVHVATAAGMHNIPALSTEEAEKMRDYIASLVQVAQEDV